MLLNKYDLIVKSYDIDYEFIFKNFTDVKLWNKNWTIFEYKGYVFKLNMYQINCQDRNITFTIKLISNLNMYFRDKETSFRHSINQFNLQVLKKQIISEMECLINSLERTWIECSDSVYKKYISAYNEEADTLRDIAKSHLDSLDITNSDLRDTYIENFVSDNEKMWTKSQKYRDDQKYCYLTDLWLIFAKATENKGLESEILTKKISNLSEIEKEIEVYIDNLNTDEYREEMEEQLEAV